MSYNWSSSWYGPVGGGFIGVKVVCGVVSVIVVAILDDKRLWSFNNYPS